MKNSYLTAGIRLGPLVRLLSRNQITWTPGNAARILFLLQSASWSSLFSKIEALKYRKTLEDSPVPHDPVFIVGHWRTGSTFLHQLMAKDPGLAAPTLFQVALPENYLVSYKFYKPIFRMVMGASRPMDNVKIGMEEPQEDEYATFRLSTFSPLERLIFPTSKSYFVDQGPFLAEGEDLERWKAELIRFYKKIHFSEGKRIVSKNPFNSLRIPLLADLFPEARFIHIIRDPMAVVPSTRHLWTIVQKQNVLNKNGYVPTLEEISVFFTQMSETIERDLTSISEERQAKVRYEELEKDPLGALETVYHKINLPFTHDFIQSVEPFIRFTTNYKKNRFELSVTEKKKIHTLTRNYMELNQYYYYYFD